MKTFKKILPILFATAVFAGNLNGMYQEPTLMRQEPTLMLQIDPKEFNFDNQQHVQTLKESYNNNLRMIIIIACGVREQRLIKENIELTVKKGERILYLPIKDKLGKEINAAHLVKAIDPLFQNFIFQLMLLIEKMPELFTNTDLLPHKKRMGLVKGITSYLDVDPILIRAHNNLTTHESRRISGQGQVTRDIINVNAKFKQCLSNLEIILQLLNDHISDQKITKKIIAIPREKQIILKGSRRRSSSGGTQQIQFLTNPNKEQKEIINNLTDQINNFGVLYATPPNTPK